MRTASGRTVTATEGSPDIFDIALGLSRQPRVGGQVREHYTVLQHSLFCSSMAVEDGQSPRIQLLCLLHDAHESVMGDIPTSLKSDAQREVQASLDKRIFHELRLVPPNEIEQNVIGHYDYRALITEGKKVGPEGWPYLEYGTPTAHDEELLHNTRRMCLPGDFIRRYFDLREVVL